MKYVCDTSVIISGKILEFIKELDGNNTFVISKATLSELEHQANSNREIGFAGFSVISKMKQIANVEIIGDYPNINQIKNAKLGDIDKSIRELAYQLDATLVTSDRVQYELAIIEDCKAIYLKGDSEEGLSILSKYFDENTMSVHLKEDVVPMAKKGTPGAFFLQKISSQKIKEQEIKELAKQLVELARRTKNSFHEIEDEGATVLQIKNYRIVITKPPFSDSFEITIVRPIKKMTLEEYNLDATLLENLKDKSKGILICGNPGSGKSTFAAALANYYSNQGKIVKTMESPRDLQVDKQITQYTKLNGSFEKTNDIMLLVRPDYSVYDELRKTEDFIIYADMRLAGIGLVGVVHASKPIDAIQRFINRVELGMISQVVDTVIFMQGGTISNVLSLNMTMKVPFGMKDADLSRPVIEVRDFFNKNVLYEIYKFGEETVVANVSISTKTSRKNKKKNNRVSYAIERLEQLLSKAVGDKYTINQDSRKINVLLSIRDANAVLQRFSKKLNRIEKRYGVRIEFETY